MGRFYNAIWILALTTVLTGCDRPPGDAEVRQALKSATGGLLSGMFERELSELKVIGCVQASPTGYKCDWTSPLGAGSGRIVKSEKGWLLVEAGQ